MYYMSNLDTKTNNHANQLSIAQKNFAKAIAQGKNRREAIAVSFPDLMSKSSNAYIRMKAYRLMMKDDILTEIADQANRLNTLGNKSITVLEDIMDVGLEHNALDASKFVYEQIHGKATQRTEVTGKFVTVVYDLSGGKAGKIPQDILDQLAD